MVCTGNHGIVHADAREIPTFSSYVNHAKHIEVLHFLVPAHREFTVEQVRKPTFVTHGEFCSGSYPTAITPPPPPPSHVHTHQVDVIVDLVTEVCPLPPPTHPQPPPKYVHTCTHPSSSAHTACGSQPVPPSRCLPAPAPVSCCSAQKTPVGPGSVAGSVVGGAFAIPCRGRRREGGVLCLCGWEGRGGVVITDAGRHSGHGGTLTACWICHNTVQKLDDGACTCV